MSFNSVNYTPSSARKISDQELKQLMLSILLDIDTFCRANNIRYSLAYGTLLGAIRHKGYIPWDDDVDIWMPRSDYMRFMKEFRHPYYSAYCAEFTPGWDHYIAKVCDDRTIIDEGHGDTCGVYVDIFTLDGWPKTHFGTMTLHHFISFYLKLWSSLHYTQKMKLNKKNGFKKNTKILASRIVGFFTTSDRVLEFALKTRMKFPYESSTNVGSLTGEWSIPRNCFENLIEAEFEGNHFLIPADYDELLKLLYGDYMQFPPEKERISNHGFQAYWKQTVLYHDHTTQGSQR